MLFNSYPFLLGFLPIVFIGFLCIGRYSHHAACLWLAAASIFFYGWWNLRFVPLLVVSILFNYGMARAIQATKSRALLSIAVVVDLAALGYFKYANFFIDNLNHVVGSQLELAPILLP